MPLLDRFRRKSIPLLTGLSAPLHPPEFTIDWRDSHVVDTVEAMHRLGLTDEPDAIFVVGERIVNSCTTWLARTLKERPNDPSWWPLFVISSEGWQASILPRESDDVMLRFVAHVAVHPPTLLRALKKQREELEEHDDQPST